MIPAALQAVVQAIKNGTVQLPSGSGDARRDAAMAESIIVSFLQNQNKWKITSPNIGSAHDRSWYDMQVDDFYCDIKVSELLGNDNTNAKKAVYYLLTGEDPAGVPEQQSRFFKSMSENESEDEERDFYFLVVKKPSADDAFIVSLKGITELTPSHNNPPFQCKWDNCRTPKKRTWKQARQFLLEHWAHSVRKGIETWEKGMPKYYGEFFP